MRLRRRQSLAAHLLGGARREGGDRLLHFLPGFDRAAEGARRHDALAIGRRVFERDAGNAAQLVDGALQHDAEPLADETRSACLRASGVVMPSAASRAASRPPTPQRSFSSMAASSASIAASSSRTQTPCAAGSFFALRLATLASVLVAAMPTETGIPVHCSTVRRSSRAWDFKPLLETAQAEEGFVDGIDFELGREAGQHPHHARAHVAVERVIAGADDDALRVRRGRGRYARPRPWECRAPWPRWCGRSHSRRCSTARRPAGRAAPAETPARRRRRNCCSPRGRRRGHAPSQHADGFR